MWGAIGACAAWAIGGIEVIKAGKLLRWREGYDGLVYSGNLSNEISLSKCLDLRLFYDRDPDDIMLCLGPWHRNDNYVLCLLGEQKIIAEGHLLKELK